MQSRWRAADFFNRTAATALITVACASSAFAGSEPDIKPTPAFKAAQLLAQPTTSWITNGGNLYNQRYSPLTQINRDNVKRLKGLWRTGMGSGTGPGTAGQAQILAYEGVVYVANGVNDVFAMDVETGRTSLDVSGQSRSARWQPNRQSESWRGARRRQGVRRPHGREARRARSANRQGAVVHSGGAVAGRAIAITAAPLYYDGLVIIGFNGGEMGTRGRLKAYDAKTGKLRWTFYTVPGAGRIRARDVAAGQRCVEARRRRLSGRRRRSIRSWVCCISPRAIRGPISTAAFARATTCFRFRSSPSKRRRGSTAGTTSKFVTISGTTTRRIPSCCSTRRIRARCARDSCEVSKTGWAYILDRETGKPLIGIEERPVPQEPRQADRARRSRIRSAMRSCRRKSRSFLKACGCSGNGEVPNKGRIFTPFWTDPITVKPGTMGGANWPPSSYDPETHLLYVCASDRISTFWVREPLEDARAEQGLHGRQFRSGGCRRRRHFRGDRRAHEQARVAAAVARDLLQRLVVTAGGLRVRGARGWPAHRARQAQRREAVGVHDGCRSEHHCDHVRAQGQAARRCARGRRRVRERQAGRWDLDVFARWEDRADSAACSARWATSIWRRWGGRGGWTGGPPGAGPAAAAGVAAPPVGAPAAAGPGPGVGASAGAAGTARAWIAATARRSTRRRVCRAMARAAPAGTEAGRLVDRRSDGRQDHFDHRHGQEQHARVRGELLSRGPARHRGLHHQGLLAKKQP